MGQSSNGGVSVDVEISRSKVYVGDELTYQVIVRGADQPSTPTVAFPDGVQANYRGQSSQSFTSTQIINGRRKAVTDRRINFQFAISPTEAGIINIPAPTIIVDGKTYTGTPVSFQSIYPTESADDQLSIHIERDQLYVNETIEVECEWVIPAKTTDFSFSSSSIPDGIELLGLELKSNGVQQVGFTINDQQIVGLVVEDTSSGTRVQKLVFRFGITPSRAGEYMLGPIRVVFTRHSGVGRSFRAYAESNTIDLSVHDVPTAEQPAGYQGVIGEFDLSVSASNTTVNEGDPIELTLDIEGKEPMGGLDRSPAVLDMSAYKNKFKVSSDGWREELPRQYGTRVYKTTVRALSEEVIAIPPVRLPSFNTTTGKYEIFESDPIDLDVHAVEEITLSDALVSGGLQSPQANSKEPRVALSPTNPGLWAHGTVVEMSRQVGFSFEKAFRDPVWIGAAAFGPTLFSLVGIGVFIKDRNNPVRKQHRINRRRYRSLERQGKNAQALRLFLADTLEIDSKSVAAQDAYKLPVRFEMIERVEQTLLASEQSSYVYADHDVASASVAHPPLIKEIEEAINKEGRA
ncbi:MAG: BatD family protein [Phycisphaerales bacterium]